MLLSELNWFAVIVNGLLSLGLGFLWMTVLFIKPYAKYMYNTDDVVEHQNSVTGPEMAKSMIVFVLFAFITAFAYGLGLIIWRVAAPALGYDPENFALALIFAVVVWAGFFLPFAIAKVVWQFKSWKVVWIDGSYELVRLLLMTVIFWYWT